MISTSRISALCAAIRESAEHALRVGCPNREPEDAHDTPESRIDVMRDDLSGILTAVTEMQAALKEERVEYAVQKIDRALQAKGAAIEAVSAYKRAMRTPEELKAQVEQDNTDLFGPER